MYRFPVRRVSFPLFALPLPRLPSPGVARLPLWLLIGLFFVTGAAGAQSAQPETRTETQAESRAEPESETTTRTEAPEASKDALQWQISERRQGRRGGELSVALTAEPRTFLPLVAYDTATRAVLERMHAGLVRLDLATLEVQPALAASWDVSSDRTRVRLELRRGVRFSDGEPFDADDVVFTFRAVQDPAVGSPFASSLVLEGKRVEVEKISSHAVDIRLPFPHPSPLLLLTGIPMLPEHRLGDAHEAASLAETWSLGTEPSEMAGLGPFRLVEHRPAARLVLERNPHYWRRDAPFPDGTALPYLDRVVFRFVADEAAKILRFRSGQSDLLERIPGEVFDALEARSRAGAPFEVRDLGPGLGFTFLIFNLNEVENLPEVERAQRWFRKGAFRRAVSLAIDRPSIARLAYHGRATPVVSSVSPANQRFYDPSLEDAGLALRGPRLAAARAELLRAGLARGEDGRWRDAEGEIVSFTVATNTSNAKRSATATLVQEDLRRLGLDVNFAGLDFGDLVQRLTKTFDYDVILLELGGFDFDPNSIANVWTIQGASHFFRLGAEEPGFEWEVELDRLTRAQARETDPEKRLELVVEAQRILAREVPFVFLVAPNVLVGAARGLENFEPAILEHPTLWNADELFWSRPADAGKL